MKSTPIRDQAHDFTRVCQVITGFVHAHHGLTAVEREIVCNFVRKLETEVGQFAPEPSTDDPSLAAPRSRPARPTHAAPRPPRRPTPPRPPPPPGPPGGGPASTPPPPRRAFVSSARPARRPRARAGGSTRREGAARRMPAAGEASPPVGQSGHGRASGLLQHAPRRARRRTVRRAARMVPHPSRAGATCGDAPLTAFRSA